MTVAGPDTTEITGFGGLALQLQSTNDQELGLAPDVTLTVGIAIAPTLLATAPSTIDLWALDEATGLWVQEGTATRNGDRYEGTVGPPPLLEVTAVWGWPVIPEDVQQATVWAAAAFAEDARQITSESIEGFSRSMNVLAPTALPLRSRDLLDQYRRVVV